MSTPKMASGPLGRLFQWLDERLLLTKWAELAGKKEVPVHRYSVWYYMGGIALTLILVQIVTGVLLMVYYIPELKSAHSSILFINSNVDFGWFIRSLHSWSANLMILVLFAHLFSTYLLKAYRTPREITWLTGLVLLVVGMGFGFSGYLLPWDMVSYFATKIGLDITSKVPLIGESMAYVLRGGETIGQATLSRFFVLHVYVLPLVLMGVLGVHLLLVQIHGMSEPPQVQAIPREKKFYEKFFPTFILKDLMIWLVVINVMVVLVALFPWGIGEEADAFAPAPVGIKPEWYFLAMFQFLKILPAMIGPIEGEQAGMLFFILIGLGFAAAPFLDKGEDAKMSRYFSWFGWVVLFGFIVFTLWGMVS